MSRTHGRIRRLLASGAVVAASAGVALLPLTASAGELSLSPSQAVDPAELAEQRAGTLTITESNGEFLIAQSQQSAQNTKTNSPINADTANGGSITIGEHALQHARGMNHVTANSGPGAMVNSLMSLTVVMKE